MTIAELRQAYADAVAKAERIERYYAAGRARASQRKTARKAAERAREAYHAVCLGGPTREIAVRPGRQIPRRQWPLRQADNDNPFAVPTTSTR